MRNCPQFHNALCYQHGYTDHIANFCNQGNVERNQAPQQGGRALGLEQELGLEIRSEEDLRPVEEFAP